MELWKENDIVMKMGWDTYADGCIPHLTAGFVTACKVKTTNARRNVLLYNLCKECCQ